MRLLSKVWRWRHWLRRRKHRSIFLKFSKAAIIGGRLAVSCTATKT